MKLNRYISIYVSFILIITTFNVVTANMNGNQQISPLFDSSSTITNNTQSINNSNLSNNQPNNNMNHPSQGKLPGFNIIDAILGLLTLSVIAFVAPRLKKEE